MTATFSESLCIRWVDLEKNGNQLLAYGHSNRINSKSELRRAAGIAEPRRRDAFVSSRVALRLILKGERDVDCFGKEFVITTNGKPYLDSVSLDFSLSRSGNLAVVALFDRAVGIDLERNRSLSKAMRSALDKATGAYDGAMGCTSGTCTSTEMSAWTRLEALIKLRDGRLAEQFTAWSDGNTARNGRAGKSRPTYPCISPKEAVALAVPAPRGYTCTCCVDAPVAPIDVANFVSP